MRQLSASLRLGRFQNANSKHYALFFRQIFKAGFGGNSDNSVGGDLRDTGAKRGFESVAAQCRFLYYKSRSGQRRTLWGTFGVLGGYRSLISDFVWIKSYLEWEKKDIAPCIASIELATAIDPYMITFWTQGASIIAFDTPHWIIGKLPKDKRTPELMAIIKKRQTRIALKFIDRALKIFPDNQELLIQKGQIAIGAGFFDIAEKAYAAVAAQPDPQIYVRRIYSSLLLKNGKFKEALKVLESILPDLDPDSPLQKIIPQQIEKTKELIKKTQS